MVRTAEHRADARAGGHDPLHQGVVEQAEAMARLDVVEGERKQPAYSLRQCNQWPALAGLPTVSPRAPAEDRLVLRPFIRADKGELLEQRMARRNVAKDLEHGFGDACSRGDERPRQAL